MVRTNRMGQTMVVPVTAGDALPAKQQLIDMLKNALPGLKSVVQNINPKATQQILGLKCRVLYGEERLLKLLNSQPIASAQSVCEAVKADVDAFVGDAPQFDDITILGFRYRGGDEGEGTDAGSDD